MQRKIVTAALLAAALLAVVSLAPSTYAQTTFCTTPNAPPAPPAPPQPPSVCGDRSCGRCTGSPCYLASGVYAKDFQDLTLRTVGFPLVVARAYDSSRVLDGPLGIGWSSSLLPHLYAVTSSPSPGAQVTQIEFAAPGGYLHEFFVSGGSVTPPVGRFDHLVLNADGTYDLTPQFSRSLYHFNVDGTIASMTDDYSNALAFTYDGSGRLLRIADQTPSGRALDVTWGPDGRLSTVTDNIARTIRYGYGADGTLATVTDPLSHVTTNAYVAGRFGPMLASVRDHWNRLFTALTWDSIGRVHSYTEGDPASGGETFTYAYDPAHQSTAKTHGFGTEVYSYDASGLRTGEGRVYDSLGRVIASPNHSYEYDSLGRMTARTIGGVRWALTYDATFSYKVASEVSDPNWPAMYYEYSGLQTASPGALLAVKQRRSDGSATEAVTTYTVGARGLVSAESTDGAQVIYAYDPNTSDVTMVNAGPVTRYAYDAVGRVTRMTDGMGQDTNYTYDALDRVLTVRLPPPVAGSPLVFQTSFTYDQYDAATGLLFQTAADPNGQTTRNGFDAVGNLRQAVDGLGKVTSYGYASNMLSSVTDANGNSTSYTYDAKRQLIQTTFPGGPFESYTYDPYTHDLKTRTDRNGATTTFYYDGLGRFVEKDFPGGESVSYNYDGAKLVQVDRFPTNRDFINYTYDTSFRVATETQTDRVKVTYTYPTDSASHAVISKTIQPINLTPAVIPRTLVYSRDQFGHVGSITWSRISGNPFTFTYDGRGMYDTVTFPNAQTRKYTYDNQGRLLSVVNRHPTSGILASFTYGYDHDWASNTNTMLGQRTSVDVATDVAGTNLLLGQTRYRYDHDYQLTRAEYPGGAWENWTYDDIGNRILLATNSGYMVPFNYSQNSAGKNSNRLTGSAQGGPYTYDSNGNVVTIAGQAVSYDLENRMTNVAGGPTYTYDPTGRRYSSKLYANQTFYLYDGLNPVTERTPATFKWNDYVFGPGVDEVLAVVEQESSTRYMAVDGLGSVVLRNDTNGNVIDSVQYTPWGGVQSGTVGSLFGYTGRETSDSGRWYYRARFYEPGIGRFLAEDPLRSTDSATNPYRYATNNPVTWTDPLGLSPCAWSEPIEQVCGVGPFDARRARQLAYEALATARRSGLPLAGEHNGPMDAFRHCYWSCRMAQEIGPEEARRVGDTHELCGTGPPAEDAMDRHNNAIGRSVGYPLINCYGVCLAMARHGRTQNAP